eukprot:Nitzschia sp. Nitz4//scaffold72_size95085//47782//48423//NITZ4_004761-RA/size95085-processed-gene-0.27-mRNA-1//-1//CDS//3329557378//6077//frame0
MLTEVSFPNRATLPHPISPMEMKRNLSLEDSTLSESISLPPKKRSKPAATAVSDGGSSSSICSSTEDQELEKKRVASRESSRRSRLREKQRLDHFTAAKYKLDQENKQIRAENDELRALIQLLQECRESVRTKQLEQQKEALQAYGGVDPAQLLTVLSGGLLNQQSQPIIPFVSTTEEFPTEPAKEVQQTPQVDYNVVLQLFMGALVHDHPSK